MEPLALIESLPPVAVTALPPDRHPVHVYIARLGSGSRRTMREALNIIASILTGGKCDAENLPWAALRYQHTAAIRAALIERYRPSSANKALAVPRYPLEGNRIQLHRIGPQGRDLIAARQGDGNHWNRFAGARRC
jgi:hypothetical protein